MRIEMINALTYSDAPGVAWQIERVRTGKSDALWLATPHEDAVHLVKKLGLLPEQVYDMYAQRYLTAIDDTIITVTHNMFGPITINQKLRISWYRKIRPPNTRRVINSRKSSFAFVNRS